MNDISSTVIEAIEALNREYITALDELDMQGWLGCFSKNSSYVFIAEENDRQNLPIAFMLDDCYERIQDRVKQVTEIQTDSTEHYQTRHFTQLMKIKEINENNYEAEFNFSVYFTRRDTNRTDLLCVGRYIDIISIGDETKFDSRKAVTDTNVLPRYVAYPV